MQGKYSIELWDLYGHLIADLSSRTQGRKFTVGRNEADEISWTLDLDDFEQYCRTSNISPSRTLETVIAEVRVRRLGTLVAAGDIMYTNVHLSADSKTVEIRARGFLDRLHARYLTSRAVFSAKTFAQMAWTMVSTAQGVTNGGMGFALGVVASDLPVFNREYNALEASIRDNIISMTIEPKGAIDVSVTLNEETNQRLINFTNGVGAVRNDILFEFPGNIIDLNSPKDGTAVANKIYALGSGIGQQGTIKAISNDLPAQQRRLREKIVTASGTATQTQLQAQADGERDAWSKPFPLPTFEVDGNYAPYVTDFKIGELVPVRVYGYDLTSDLIGNYAVEKIAMEIDDNDNERMQVTVSAG